MMEIDGTMSPEINLVDTYDKTSTLKVTMEDDVIDKEYFGFVTVDDSSFVEDEAIFCMTPAQARQLATFLSDELERIGK